MIAGLRPGLVILALSLLTAGAVATADENGSLRIRDARVRDAFAKVERDVFVPENAAERAYDDKPLPAGYAQTISQPALLARMIDNLQLKAEDRVLEIGTGTGYSAAVLGELAREVFSVGVIPELATTARLRLTREGYQNVHVKLGDGALGWREYAPYDAIIVTSIGARVPPALIEQLVEGGVLVMVVGPARGRQVLIRGVKKGFKLHAKEVSEVRAPASDARRADQGSSPPRRGASSDGVREERRSPRSDESQSDR